MKKIILLIAVTVCVTTTFAQEVKEYATVSTNLNDRKKVFITFGHETLEWQSKDKKTVTVKQVMSVLNELSLQGWRVHTAYATAVGGSYLLERTKP